MTSNIRHSTNPILMHCWLLDGSNSLNGPTVDPATAPHDCMMPGCPGPENKRKLEAFEELLILLQRSMSYLKVCGENDINGYSEYDPCLYEEVGAALAKETGSTEVKP